VPRSDAGKEARLCGRPIPLSGRFSGGAVFDSPDQPKPKNEEEVISDGCIAEAPGDPDATGDAPGA